MGRLFRPRQRGGQSTYYPLLFNTGGRLCGSETFVSDEEENNSDTAVNNDDWHILIVDRRASQKEGKGVVGIAVALGGNLF